MLHAGCGDAVVMAGETAAGLAGARAARFVRQHSKTATYCRRVVLAVQDVVVTQRLDRGMWQKEVVCGGSVPRARRRRREGSSMLLTLGSMCASHHRTTTHDQPLLDI